MSLVSSNTLTQSYLAVPDSVPLARRELADFAALAGANGDQLEAIRLSVSEALTNVVMHAYQGGRGHIHVEADVAGNELWVLIGDDGGGLRADRNSPGLGVGLALIAQSSDGLTIMNRAGGGTEVRMCFSLESGGLESYVEERGSSFSACSPATPRFSTTT
jgi:stage II sporulation protein AB (anti-sigma F factor)